MSEAETYSGERRRFLKLTGRLLGGTLLCQACGLPLAQARDALEQPLKHYPAREWEKLYRQQYAYSARASCVCAADAQGVFRASAIVRDGTLARVEAEATHRPDARALCMPRLLSSPKRAPQPLCRKAWKKWADEGFPALSAELRTKFKFDARRSDEFVKISWEQALKYTASALLEIARFYSGDDGVWRLRDQHYDPLLVNAVQNAGTRTCKFLCGCHAPGVLNRAGLGRLATTLACVDAALRGTRGDDALGGRLLDDDFSTPLHWAIHGRPAYALTQLSDLQASSLIILDNCDPLLSDPADAHALFQAQRRGATLVTLAPTFGPAASQSDYWIQARPGSSLALWLELARRLVQGKHHDSKFMRAISDLREGALMACLKDAHVERWQPLTGVSDQMLQRLSDDILTRKPVAIVVGQHTAAEVVRAVLTVLTLSGNLGRAGAGCCCLGAALPASELRPLTHEDPFKLSGRGEAPTRVERALSGATPTKALIVSHRQVPFLAPEQLALTDLIVLIDPFTADDACDLQLPASLPVELRGEELFIDTAARVAHLGKGVVVPRLDTRDPLEIYSGIATALSTQLQDSRCADYWRTPREALLQRALDCCSLTAGCRRKDFESQGSVWLPPPPRLSLEKPLPTQSGRLQLAGPYRPIDALLPAARDGIGLMVLPTHLRPLSDWELQLTTLAGACDGVIELHPDDAQNLRAVQGSQLRVQLEGAQKVLALSVRINAGVPKGWSTTALSGAISTQLWDSLGRIEASASKLLSLQVTYPYGVNSIKIFDSIYPDSVQSLPYTHPAPGEEDELFRKYVAGRFTGIE